MKLSLVMAALAGFLAATTAQAQAPETAGDANRGRLLAIGGLFGEMRIGCVQCHGLDGAGDSSGAFPRLTNQSGWYLYKSLMDYAEGLRPNDIMGPIARTLTERQMRELAAHYAAVRSAPFPAQPEVDTQTLQTGGSIAAVGLPARGVPSCTSCHGADGAGGGLIYPSLAGQSASYLEQQLKLWKQGRRDGDAMNVMELIAKAMSDEQIRAVSIYYAAARPRDADARGSTPADGAAAAAAPPDPTTIGLPQRPLTPNVLPPYLAPPDRSDPAAAASPSGRR